MSESADYKAFKNHVITPRDRLDRIENCMIPGMPDTNICIDGVESWIELKSPKEPKRSTTNLFGSNHPLSQDQMNWLLRQRNARGRAHVLIVTDARWLLIDGKHGDVINDLTVTELIAIAEWHATKPIRSKEEWKRLRTLLQQ